MGLFCMTDSKSIEALGQIFDDELAFCGAELVISLWAVLAHFGEP